MNKVVIIFIISQLCPLILQAQSSDENQTGNYINSIYYYNRLDYMRSSYDRWQCMMNDYAPDEDVRDYNFGIYSAINDFNLASDADGNKIYPMLIGYALGAGKSNFGYYFLLSSTDVSRMRQKDAIENKLTFEAATAGFNFQTKYFSLMTDFTYANSGLSVYGKIFVPAIKSHFGIGSSPYDEIIDPVSKQKKVIRSNIRPDQFIFGTSVLQYVNLGLKLFTMTKTRYMPNISTAAHNFISEKRWGSIKYDAEFFFETRGEKWENFFKMQDFDTRFVLYRFLDKPDEVSDTDLGMALRWAVFVGTSYKSELNYFDETISESGLVYNGQSGLGFDVGCGMRVLGFKKYGFQEDTYVRLSYFYNYSQYFERFPGMKQGLKFKVIF